MPSFESYTKPIAPNGTSLFVIYFLYMVLSILYAYNQEAGIKSPSTDSAIFIAIIVLSFPFIFWPLTGDVEFAKEYLEPFGLNPGIEDSSALKVIKKFFGGYVIALTFPFLKLKTYLVGDKNNPKLKSYTQKEYFNYYIIPLIGFIIFLSALVIAIYFNENVINATNDVGIFLMDPDQRRTYQIIFSFLIFTIFFSLIPYRMAEALDKTWNYYLMFFFSIVNLIIINQQLNAGAVYRKNVLTAVYIITIVLLFYSVYNLVYMSSESKDYRILTLGKLSDEDRININGQLYGIYDSVRLINDDEEHKYFDNDNYFQADKAKDAGFNADDELLRQFQGSRKEGFANILKRLDQDFINIYQARMSWEKSLKRFFKAKGDDKKNIINGFFESGEFRNLERMESPSLSQAATAFRKDWEQTRKSMQLPKPGLSQALFGAAVTTMGGNIALSVAASKILREIDTVIQGNVSILFHRYMFVILSQQFSIVSQVFKDFEIYSIGDVIKEGNTDLEPGGIGEEIYNNLTQVSNFFEKSNKLTVDYTNILLQLKENKKPDDKLISDINRNNNIYHEYNYIFSNYKNKGLGLDFGGYNMLDVLRLNNFEIFVQLSRIRCYVNRIIAIYNYNIANSDRRREIYKKYHNEIKQIQELGISSIRSIYNFSGRHIINVPNDIRRYLLALPVITNNAGCEPLRGFIEPDHEFGNGARMVPPPPVGTAPPADGVGYYETRPAIVGHISLKIIDPLKIEEYDHGIRNQDVKDYLNIFQNESEEFGIDNFLKLPDIVFDNTLLNPNQATYREGNQNIPYFEYGRDIINRRYLNLLRAISDLNIALYSSINNMNSGIENYVKSQLILFPYSDNNSPPERNLHDRIINMINVKIALDDRQLLNDRENDVPDPIPTRQGVPVPRHLGALINEYTATRETITAANRNLIIGLILRSDKELQKYKSNNSGIIKNYTSTIGSFLTSTKSIDESIKFFRIDQPAYPGDETSLNDIEEGFTFKWNVTTPPDKLNVSPGLAKPITNYLDRADNVNMSSNFDRLSAEQKNTILNTDKFRRIYKYFFNQKAKNSQDVDKLYTKFLAIYRAYITTLRTYMRHSNPSKKDKDITSTLITELQLIGEGFPQIMRDNDSYLFGKQSLINLIDIGTTETAYSEEIFSDIINRSDTFKQNRAMAAQAALRSDEEIKKLNLAIETGKTKLFSEVINILSGGSNSTASVGGQKVVSINYVTDKKIAGFTVGTKLNQMAFNAMTRLLLKSIQFLKGDDNWTKFKADKAAYLNADNVYQLQPFLTTIIATLFTVVFPNGTGGGNGIIRTGGFAGNADTIIRNNTVAGVAADEINITENIFQVSGGGTPTETRVNINNFINNINTEVNFTIREYEDINLDLKDILNNMEQRLSTIVGELRPVTRPDANSNYMNLIINSSASTNNIYYYMLTKISESINASDNNNDLEGLIDNGAGGNINYRPFITNLTKKLTVNEQQLLVAILDKDFTKEMENPDNRANPLATITDVIKNNPIVNALKVII